MLRGEKSDPGRGRKTLAPFQGAKCLLIDRDPGVSAVGLDPRLMSLNPAGFDAHENECP